MLSVTILIRCEPFPGEEKTRKGEHASKRFATISRADLFLVAAGTGTTTPGANETGSPPFLSVRITSLIKEVVPLLIQ